jgi:hypothetical protein
VTPVQLLDLETARASLTKDQSAIHIARGATMSSSQLWQSFDFNQKVLGNIFRCPLEWVISRQELRLRRDASIIPWVCRMILGPVPFALSCYWLILRELFSSQRHIPPANSIFFFMGASMSTFLFAAWILILSPFGNDLVTGLTAKRNFEISLRQSE